MERIRKAALRLLRTTFILLCKLLLVDVVCSSVSDWLFYYLFTRKRLTSNKVRPPPHPNIEVIICGFPRSGCTTLWQAMDILDFPCFHGAHLSKPSTSRLFIKAQVSGARQDWEHLLHGYKAIVDYCAASSYKQLIQMYPNAKVILNVRDPKRWYNSLSQTFFQHKKSLIIEVVQPCFLRCATVYFYQKLLDNPDNEESSITNYKLHIEEVKRHVPSDKLYVLDIEKNEGWAPLCEFLEVPIPNVPFPFMNKRENMKKVLYINSAICWGVLICYLLLFFIVSIICSSSWIFPM